MSHIIASLILYPVWLFLFPMQDEMCVCVCVQMLTPHNKGLIRRAITQSGVALCPWAVNRNPRAFAEEVTMLMI